MEEKEPKNAKQLMSDVGYDGDQYCFEAGIEQESSEHPEVSQKTIASLVKDHLQSDPKYYDGGEEEKESYPGRDANKNKFKKMSRVKADMEAEKAGEYD